MKVDISLAQSTIAQHSQEHSVAVDRMRIVNLTKVAGRDATLCAYGKDVLYKIIGIGALSGRHGRVHGEFQCRAQVCHPQHIVT